MNKGAMDYSRFDVPEGTDTEAHTFTVEIHTGIKEYRGWDLLCEDVSWNQALNDAKFMKKRNYEVRVKDERGIEWNI